MCVVRCLNRATGSGILENMVHSRATYSKAQIWSWPMSPEVFRNSWNQAPRAACPGREFSVLTITIQKKVTGTKGGYKLGDNISS